MRQLINNYTFTAGTRDITIQSAYQIGVHNVRLIVNETQKVVICSSMQKDNISIANNVITYSSSLPALASGDSITIEIDLGEDLNASMNDILLKVKNAGAGGTPFSIGLGSYLDTELTYALANNKWIYKDFFSNTALESFASSITSVENIAYSFQSGVANCPNLRKVSFPYLTKIGGGHTFDKCFLNDTTLKELEFPAFSNKPDYDCFLNAFLGIPNGSIKLTTHYMQCNAEWTNSYRGLVQWIGDTLKTIVLVGTPNVDMNLSTNGYLDADGVKEVLTKCANANMSGKTITFYSGGLTVQDDAEGTLQTLYNSVVNTYGATIANLTITPYSA